MAKTKIEFVCQNCGARAPKWVGKCSECGEFNTLVEEIARPEETARRPVLSEDKPIPITEVQPVDRPRLVVGVGEFDRVLGGGIVLGSVSLIGGDPGIGKSTLILQVCQRIAAQGHPVLYVSSEESVIQTKLRAERLGVNTPSLFIVSETNVAVIRKYLEETRPKFAVIDSIQMIYRPEIPGAPGTVSQVRECSADLTFLAKRLGISLFIVGHVTKEGAIAGPRTLEHVVDAVFYFEGDRFQTFRLLRGVKNRFGSTNELGVFEMTGTGLVGVPDPSAIFGRSEPGEVGAAVACTLEGTRPLLLEIQSLVAPTDLAMPRRVGTGVDPKRLAMIVAVLTRHAAVPLAAADVFVNVAGGVRIDEPGADLGIALAIASAARGSAVREGLAAFGEVGLTGRLRAATQAERRLEECRKLGLAEVLAPAGTSGASLETPTLGRALAAGLAEKSVRAAEKSV